MNECYIKLLNAVQAECEKHDDCIYCKYKSLCEEMDIALAIMDSND